MKIRYIPYLTIVLAAFLLSACHSIMDDEVCADQPSDTTTPVQIGFTLTTGDVSSRVTEEPEAGTGRENYIDIANNNFRILLFKTDNTYLTALKVNRITQTGNDGTTYYVEGELDKAYTDFKLVVLANWGTTYADNWTPETTIADVCEATYSYSSSFNINNDLIPMYGVQTYSDVEFRADLLTELPTDIDLLRAMAKIQVTCNAEGFELDEVKLHRYNTSGYCAPTGVDEDTATDWKYEENAVCNHVTHIPANSVSESSLAFTDTETEDGFIIYVPEFDNKTNTEERSYIEVSLIHTDDKSPVNLEETNIYFCLYDEENGTPTPNTDFNIVRNHWYKYDITNVDDGKLIFQYKALPWQLVKSSIGYAPQHVSTSSNPFANETSYNEFINGNNYVLFPLENYEDYHTTQGLFNHLYDNPQKGDNEARLCIITRPTYDESTYKDDKDKHMSLKTGSAGARYYFMLTGPEGATWEAHLNDPDGNFAFSNSVNDDDFTNCTDEGFSKEVRMATHGIAREQPYIIQIVATHLYTSDGDHYTSGISDLDTEPRFENVYEDLGLGTDEDKWETYFDYTYLTTWGKDKWDNKKTVEAEFYITVKLTDGTEYELTINPSFKECNIENKYFPFKEKRRFAGRDTRIWFRHLRAQYGWRNLECLARDLKEDIIEDGEDEAQPWNKADWWTVNPYWNSEHVESVWK